MAGAWYYTSNRQQQGPISWHQLCLLAQDGVLRPTDLIWQEGMTDWVRASSKGLFPDREPISLKDDSHRDDRLRDDAPRRTIEDDRPRRRRPDRDEVFDDDFDRPRRRRRSQGMPTGAKVALIVGGVVLAVAGVSLVLILALGGGGAASDVPPQGLVFNDSLRAFDAHDTRRGLPCKIFRVNFTANSTYVIDHQSGAFDAYLRLEDPMGANVAEDDDSGGNLNARIIFRAPQTGTYRIIATSFRGGTGAFTLTVRKT